MLDLPSLEHALMRRAYAEAAPTLASWFGEDGLRRNLAEAIRHDLASGSDVAQIVECLGGERVVVLLPSTRTLDPLKTAIVVHRTFAVDDDTDLASLARDIREAIMPVVPDLVLLFMHGTDRLARPPADLVVAGQIDALHETPLPPSTDVPIRMVEPSSIAMYDMYEQWYHEFWRRRPHLKKHVRIETRDDLAACLAGGGLRVAMLGDVPCALLAAERRVEYGLTGWKMRERVTSPDFWGRGISSAALVRFARDLDHAPHDAIWGNIVPDNEASLKSAQRIGRTVVGAFYAIDSSDARTS